MTARHLRGIRVQLDPEVDHGYGDGSEARDAERALRWERYMIGWTAGARGDSADSELAGDADHTLASAYTVGHRIGKGVRAKATLDAATLFCLKKDRAAR